MKTKKLLIIAGSDPTTGAGIQSDCLTAYSLGVYPMTVITSITVQNDLGVHLKQDLDASLVKAQLEGLLSRFQFDAVKIGMLGNTEILRAVTDCLKSHRQSLGPIVLDPVLKASNTFELTEGTLIRELKSGLMPLLTLMTPNLHEYIRIFAPNSIAVISDCNISAFQESFTCPDDLSCNLLIKGGHFLDSACDFLFTRESLELLAIDGTRLEATFTHGTGCTLSTAICAFLTKGHSLDMAVQRAKTYLREGLKKPHLFTENYGAINKAPFRQFDQGDPYEFKTQDCPCDHQSRD